MLYEHDGRRPEVHPTATVAPTAVISGDVVIGPNTCVLHGAILSSEGGSIRIGRQCVIMEQAVLRGTKPHPLNIGSNVLIGPHAHITGCSVGDDVFLATGTRVFNGALIGNESVVRIDGVVHVSTELPAESLVPIGWIAVGSPATILPPNEHDEIWAIQETLNFPQTVFGVERSRPGASKMPELCRKYVKYLGRHKDDVLID